MTNMRGFAAAQRAYDNMTPPDDGPSQCADCDGSGYDQEGEYCATCEGSGYVNDDGSAYDPEAAEFEACEYYDRKKDES